MHILPENFLPEKSGNFIEPQLHSVVAKLDARLYRYAMRCKTIPLDFAQYAQTHILSYRRVLRDPNLSPAELAYRLRQTTRHIYEKANLKLHRDDGPAKSEIMSEIIPEIYSSATQRSQKGAITPRHQEAR